MTKMADVTPNNAMTLLLTDIAIPKRRAIDESAISTLVSSIEALGLRTPITVRNLGGTYSLVTGGHRIEAFRRLGRARIPAYVVKMDDVDARMWEIAENLHRADVTVVERSDQITEYAKLEKEKRKAQGAQLGHPDKRYEQRGDSAAARDLGLSRQDIQRAEKIASMSTEAKKAAFEDEGIKNNQAALLRVANAPKQEQVAAVESEKERRVARTQLKKQKADKLHDESLKREKEDHLAAIAAVAYLLELVPDEQKRRELLHLADKASHKAFFFQWRRDVEGWQ